MYDARNPAPGVRVDYLPQPKITGLSMAQAKGRRTFDPAAGVMRHPPLCSPIKTGGGGLPSPAVLRNGGTAKPIEGRIGVTLERGLPRTGKAPTNKACKRPLPPKTHYGRLAVDKKLAALRDLFRRAAGSEDYLRMRASFLKLHEEHRQRLFAIEKGR